MVSKVGKVRYRIKNFRYKIGNKSKKVFRASLSKGQSLTKRNPNSTQLVLTACLSAGSVATYYRDNWFRIPVLVGVLFLCYIQFYKTRKREERRLKALAANPAEVEVDDYLAYLYQFLPLRTGSRVVGFVGERELPRPVLNPILNFYCWYFNVNLEEAVQESLDAYRTLGDFFQRELKPTVRQIDRRSPLVIPCDGRVLHYGKCENGVVEQVKGVRYPVERFLGCHPQLSDPEANDLFYCVLYLAPGDYHLFHSPCSWTVDKVIHFPGTLMSVNPSVCKLVPNILTLNERVLMSGTWEHGYFSYTAVGATNVGSIRINFLKDKIKTNKGFLSFESDTEIEIEPKQEMGRGEMIGGFNFGSTVVLMFEAPKSFEFNLQAEQVIRLGSALGHVPGRDYSAPESDERNCDDIAFQIMDDLKETFNDVVNETQETWNEVVQETQDAVNEVVHETQETFNDVVNETQETLKEVVQETQETLNEVVNDTQETLNDVVNETQETFHEVVQAIYNHDSDKLEDIKSAALISPDIKITDSEPSKGEKL